MKTKEGRRVEIESYRVSQAGLRRLPWLAKQLEYIGAYHHMLFNSRVEIRAWPGSVCSSQIASLATRVSIVFTLVLPQVQPFFSSCLNDCLRHAVTVPCQVISETPGRRRIILVGGGEGEG